MKDKQIIFYSFLKTNIKMFQDEYMKVSEKVFDKFNMNIVN